MRSLSGWNAFCLVPPPCPSILVGRGLLRALSLYCEPFCLILPPAAKPARVQPCKGPLFYSDSLCTSVMFKELQLWDNPVRWSIAPRMYSKASPREDSFLTGHWSWGRDLAEGWWEIKRPGQLGESLSSSPETVPGFLSRLHHLLVVWTWQTPSFLMTSFL